MNDLIPMWWAVIFCCLMMIAYMANFSVLNTSALQNRVAQAPALSGSTNGKVWTMISSYLETAFHYLRKSIYLIAILFAAMILMKSYGYIQVAYAISGVEFVIIIALALRWQWFGLSALLGGITAILEKTETNDPDVSEAILGGVKAFGKTIGYTLLTTLLLSGAILVVPWETSPDLTFVFFGVLFLTFFVFLYSILEGFTSRFIRHCLVFGGAGLGFYLLGNMIWNKKVEGVTTWVSGVVPNLWNWKTLVLLIGIALLCVSISLFMNHQTWVAPRGIARRNPTMRRYALGLLVLGAICILAPIILAINAPQPLTWSEKILSQITQLTQKKADETGRLNTQQPPIADNTAAGELPFIDGASQDQPLSIPDNESITFLAKGRVQIIYANGYCVDVSENVTAVPGAYAGSGIIYAGKKTVQVTVTSIPKSKCNGANTPMYEDQTNEDTGDEEFVTELHLKIE